MKNHLQYLHSPHFLHRKLSRISAPSILFILAIIINCLSIKTSITPWLRNVWLFLTIGLILFDDITSHDSLIIHITYYAKKIFSKKIVPTTENKNFVPLIKFRLMELPAFLEDRRNYVWIVSALITFLAWGYYLGLILSVDEKALNQKILLFFILFLFQSLPLGQYISEATHFTRFWQNHWAWHIVLGMGAFILASPLFFMLGIVEYIFTFIAILITLERIYITQRLWSAEKALNQVIRDFANSLLTEKHHDLQNIPEMIRSRLRYENVFILKKTPEVELEVIGQAGKYPNVLNQSMPPDCITMRSIRNRQPVAWNDVAQCPYYFRVPSISKKEDITQAEIAVPIFHNEHLYGVIDVQSSHVGVFRWGDIEELEILARILGAAMASEEADDLLEASSILWNEITFSSIIVDEKHLFDKVSHFILNRMGASNVIYYSLSPTGFPIHTPIFSGEIKHQEEMENSFVDMDSPLIDLISDWREYVSENVSEDPRLRNSRFVMREENLSTYFVPIGIQPEPLGVLLVNYKNPKIFGALDRLIFQNIAHSCASQLWRLRYNQVYIRGFGLSTLDLHHNLARLGLKDVSKNPSQFSNFQFPQSRHEILSFLRQLTMVEAASPPDFLMTSLRSALEKFNTGMLPLENSDRRPIIALLIDRKVEKENSLVKLAIYRFVTETIMNALSHGKASNVDVVIERKPAEIYVKVSNNGSPFVKDEEIHATGKGIFFLKKILNKYFEASIKIDQDPVVVTLSIPALPFHYKE